MLESLVYISWTCHGAVLTHSPAQVNYSQLIVKTCRKLTTHVGRHAATHTVHGSVRKLCQSAKIVNKGLLSTLSNWLPCCLLSPAFNLTRYTIDRGSYYSWLYQYCNERPWYQLTTAFHRRTSMKQNIKQQWDRLSWRKVILCRTLKLIRDDVSRDLCMLTCGCWGEFCGHPGTMWSEAGESLEFLGGLWAQLPPLTPPEIAPSPQSLPYLREWEKYSVIDGAR